MFLFSELKTKYSEKEDDKTECGHVDVKEDIYYRGGFRGVSGVSGNPFWVGL